MAEELQYLGGCNLLNGGQGQCPCAKRCVCRVRGGSSVRPLCSCCALAVRPLIAQPRAAGQVAQHRLAAEERITSLLASAAGQDADGGMEDEAGSLQAWEGQGAYQRREWGDGPPPPEWQLADWVSTLRAEEMVASAIAGQIAATRRDGAAETEDITVGDVARLSAADVAQIAQTSANLLSQALRQRISELREAATAAAAAPGPGTHRSGAAKVADPSHSADKFTLSPSRMSPSAPPVEYAPAGGARGAGGREAERAGRQSKLRGDVKMWREIEREWVAGVGLLTCEHRDVFQAMRDEHLDAADSHTAFALHPATTSERRARGVGGVMSKSTTPAAEWLVVAGPSIVKVDGTFDETSLPLGQAPSGPSPSALLPACAQWSACVCLVTTCRLACGAQILWRRRRRQQQQQQQPRKAATNNPQPRLCAMPMPPLGQAMTFSGLETFSSFSFFFFFFFWDLLGVRAAAFVSVGLS